MASIIHPPARRGERWVRETKQEQITPPPTQLGHLPTQLARRLELGRERSAKGFKMRTSQGDTGRKNQDHPEQESQQKSQKSPALHYTETAEEPFFGTSSVARTRPNQRPKATVVKWKIGLLSILA